MKNTLAILFIALLIGLLLYAPAKAQVQLSVNIGQQPLWGPANYNHVDYYYMPEADVYYNVPSREYIYMNQGQWVYAATLPPSYHVDLYRTYKVVINEPQPYLRHSNHVQQYGRYKTHHGKQMVIRDSRDEKYYQVDGHPGRNRALPPRYPAARSKSYPRNSERVYRSNRKPVYHRQERSSNSRTKSSPAKYKSRPNKQGPSRSGKGKSGHSKGKKH